tara:strand:+ start:7291 stop:8121 length:831 start_codon:yes stop_codon:yes gene_type:complete
MNHNKNIKLKNYNISNESPLTVIAGPCAAESIEHCYMMAKKLKEISERLNFNLIFKSSFDKANRTSIKSMRGIGLNNSIKVFSQIKNNLDLPILTDVHEPWQCDVICDYVDVIQIPAFLARQTDLMIAAAKTGKIINIKKSQFMSPWDIKYAIEKITNNGNNKIIVTERGTSFGYNNLVVDYRSLEIFKKMDIPVAFDATHSIQLPGGLDGKSSGQREFIQPLSISAIANGISCFFSEVHDNPIEAISDSDNQLTIEDFENIIFKLLPFDKLAKGY